MIKRGKNGKVLSLSFLGLVLFLSIFGIFEKLCAVINGNEVITTIAGGGVNDPGDGGPATSASIGDIYGVVTDNNGNVYLSDFYKGKTRKIDRYGVISTVITNVAAAGLALDQSGNIYFTEPTNQRIGKIDLLGNVSTVAGNGITGFSGDGGPAISARISLLVQSVIPPNGLAVDNSGNIYIADSRNGRIRKVNSAGIINSIVAGLPGPAAVTLDGSGNLYVANRDGSIKKYDTQGRLTNVGNHVGPKAIGVDSSGNLYVASSNRIYRGGTPIAGNGTFDPVGDCSSAISAALFNPKGIAFDGADNMYIADVGRVRILGTNMDKIPPTISNLIVNPTEIWPPNHKLVNINLGAVITDNLDVSPTFKISNVSSNEPIGGLENGDEEPDWIITDYHTLQLRAEKNPKGEGRIYTIELTGRDRFCNTAVISTTVTVPKNKEK